MSAPDLGVWLSTPNVPLLEMAAGLGYAFVMIDAEHGSFGPVELDGLLVVARGLGLDALVKVAAPERVPVQQALDFGADGVVLPHVLDVEHARRTTGYAKFPPGGDRSFAGGRTVGYAGPDDEWFARQDAATRCYPMVEDRLALRDVEQILALPTVDGVCTGMSDLSLSRGRGRYRHSAADWEDLEAIAGAARRAGKPWIMPAWAREEQRRAVALGVARMVVTMEFAALREGLAQSLDRAHDAIASEGRA